MTTNRNLAVLIVSILALVASIVLLLVARLDLKESEAMVADMEVRVDTAQEHADIMTATCARWTQQGYVD